MRIFLSHSSADKSRVRDIVARLPSTFHCWIDELEILAGEHFEKRIRAAIVEEEAVVVVFVSGHSAHSEWVRKELRWARRADVPVIPVVLDRDAVSALPRWAQRLHYVRAYDQSEAQTRASAGELAEHLSRWVTEGEESVSTPVEDLSASLLQQFAELILSRGLTDHATMIAYTPLVVFNFARLIAKWHSLLWSEQTTPGLKGTVPSESDMEYFYVMDTLFGFHLQHFRDTGELTKVVLPHGNDEADLDCAWRKYMDEFLRKTLLNDDSDPCSWQLAEGLLSGLLLAERPAGVSDETLRAVLESRSAVVRIGMNVCRYFGLGPLSQRPSQ